MPTQMYASFSSAYLKNNNPIHSSNIDINYDGEIMDIRGNNQQHAFHKTLDNDDIMKLLTTRTNSQSIHNRLL